MADIEKVTKGLEHCLSRYVDGLCDDCPYMGAIDKTYMIPMKCKEIIMRDALELLKEQNGLAKALEQMIATNAYLNAEKERQKNLLEHREAEVAILSRSSIVLCKDCTFRGEINCPQYYRKNELSDDYYCADGERKDGEPE